jgi:hypothetical protein
MQLVENDGKTVKKWQVGTCQQTGISQPVRRQAGRLFFLDIGGPSTGSGWGRDASVSSKIHAFCERRGSPLQSNMDAPATTKCVVALAF